MKELMFGWEFPPHITGGLGTACYGITKGLAKQNIKVNKLQWENVGKKIANIYSSLT